MGAQKKGSYSAVLLPVRRSFPFKRDYLAFPLTQRGGSRRPGQQPPFLTM